MVAILNKLSRINSTNEKVEYASKHFTKFHHELFEVCFDDKKINLSKKTMIKALNLDENDVKKYTDLGEYLSINYLKDNSKIKFLDVTLNIKKFKKELSKYSGHNLLNKFKELLFKLPDEYRPWYIRALLGNMRVGVNFNLYNKIREKQGLNKLQKFYVKLASNINLNNINKLKYPISCELKYDGIRCILIKKNNKVILKSRNGKNITEQFPEIVSLAKLINKNIILDGEIISKNFNTLQHRLGRKKENINEDKNIKYIVFDILEYADKNLRDKIYLTRLQILNHFLQCYRFIFNKSTHIIAENDDMLKDFYFKMIKTGEEGIMIKELNSLYDNSRNNWYKLKPIKEADLKIINAKYGTGKNKDYISSLYCEDEQGNKVFVGSGINDDDKILLTKLYKENKLINKYVEIQYQEKTKNSYRFPRFIRLRLDK